MLRQSPDSSTCPPLPQQKRYCCITDLVPLSHSRKPFVVIFLHIYGVLLFALFCSCRLSLLLLMQLSAFLFCYLPISLWQLLLLCCVCSLRIIWAWIHLLPLDCSPQTLPRAHIKRGSHLNGIIHNTVNSSDDGTVMCFNAVNYQSTVRKAWTLQRCYRFHRMFR